MCASANIVPAIFYYGHVVSERNTGTYICQYVYFAHEYICILYNRILVW